MACRGRSASDGEVPHRRLGCDACAGDLNLAREGRSLGGVSFNLARQPTRPMRLSTWPELHQRFLARRELVDCLTESGPSRPFWANFLLKVRTSHSSWSVYE